MEKIFNREDSSAWSEYLTSDDDMQLLFPKSCETYTGSSEDTPIEDWSLYIKSNKITSTGNEENNQTRDLLSHGSENICAKYMAVSDSDVYTHSYYRYPAVVDPGIMPALLKPIPPLLPYCEDGVDLYKALCEEVNEVPVRLFYDNLLNPEINLSYYCVSSQGVRIMTRALQFNRYVRCLDLTDTFLDTDACYHLGQMIKLNSYLQALILNGCRMKESGLRLLGDELNLNVSLKTLSIAGNELTDNGGELFAKLIENGANVNNINLSNNKLGVKTLLALNEALLVNHYLTHIDLSHNSCVHIPTMVTFLQTVAFQSELLEHLNLSWMELQDVRIAKAIALIMLVPKLENLNLCGNWFSDDCAPYLVENLMQSTHLDTYNLSYNRFSPKGAYLILQKLLRPRVRLKKLYLNNICVNRDFIALLTVINSMKCRKNFIVTHDKVLHDWVAIGKDDRDLVLKRGEYLGKTKKGEVVKVDVPLFLLSLSYAAEKLTAKEVLVMMKLSGIPVDKDWVKALIDAFPGPIVNKKGTLSTALMREYIKRLWPEKKLPSDFKPPVVVQVDVKRKTKSTMDLSKEEQQKVKKGKRKKIPI